MTATFLILAAVTVAGTTAAMFLRNAVHCVLALTVAFVGVAALYLQLGAQFVGLTQIMVYVGAVAILAVFVIMMTHTPRQTTLPVLSASWFTGLAIAVAVFLVLAWAIHAGGTSLQPVPPEPGITVRQIGESLMHSYVLPLELMGLLLTAALIGAVVIAMDHREDGE